MRHAVVRLRGRFLVARHPDRSLPARVRRAVGPRAYAFVEYANAERTAPDGARYWLPATQRVELQATAPAVGDVRAGSVKRVASAVGEGSVVVSDIHKALAPPDQ